MNASQQILKETKKAALRRVLESDGTSMAIGVHDAVGARLGEMAGFDALWSSGLEVSASRGVPDANILSLSECLEAAAVLGRGSELPVLADCDNGFGGPANVAHLVREYEARGIAGVCFEDKAFPKLNSFCDGPQKLENSDEFAAKVAAAVEARDDRDFVVVARVEALIAGAGLNEALERARLYVDAGADSILIHSKKDSPNEVFEFISQFHGLVPVIVVPTMYPNVDVQTLSDAGAGLAIYANQGLRSALRAMLTTFERIRQDGSTREVENLIAPVQCVLDLFDTRYTGR